MLRRAALYVLLVLLVFSLAPAGAGSGGGAGGVGGVYVLRGWVPGDPLTVSWAPGGDVLALVYSMGVVLASADGGVVKKALYDITPEEARRIPPGVYAPLALWSPEGDYLAVASTFVVVLDRGLEVVYKDFESWVVVWSSGWAGGRFWYATREGVYVVDPSSRAASYRSASELGLAEPLVALSTAPSGEVIVADGEGRAVVLRGGERVAVFELEGGVSGACISPDGRYAVLAGPGASGEGVAVLYAVEGPRVVATLEGLGEHPRCWWPPESAKGVVAGRGGAYLVDPERGEFMEAGFDADPGAFAVSPDGGFLVAANGVVYSLETGEEVSRIDLPAMAASVDWGAGGLLAFAVPPHGVLVYREDGSLARLLVQVSGYGLPYALTDGVVYFYSALSGVYASFAVDLEAGTVKGFTTALYTISSPGSVSKALILPGTDVVAILFEDGRPALATPYGRIVWEYPHSVGREAAVAPDPRGRYVAFGDRLIVDSSGSVVLEVEAESHGGYPAWSRDGSWLAVASLADAERGVVHVTIFRAGGDGLSLAGAADLETGVRWLDMRTHVRVGVSDDGRVAVLLPNHCAEGKYGIVLLSPEGEEIWCTPLPLRSTVSSIAPYMTVDPETATPILAYEFYKVHYVDPETGELREVESPSDPRFPSTLTPGPHPMQVTILEAGSSKATIIDLETGEAKEIPLDQPLAPVLRWAIADGDTLAVYQESTGLFIYELTQAPLEHPASTAQPPQATARETAPQTTETTQPPGAPATPQARPPLTAIAAALLVVTIILAALVMARRRK